MNAKRESPAIWFIVISAAIIILLVIVVRMLWTPADDPTVPGQEVPIPVVVGQAGAQ